MNYFFDTEFIEDGRTIDLLSIGIVSEDGREFYAEVDQRDVDYEHAGPWVKENVIKHLWNRQNDKSEFNGWSRDGGTGGVLRRTEIANEIIRFVGQNPVFWSYYADYDWVVLCQLYGRMIDLPKTWPMYCRDLKQLIDMYRINPPEQTGQEHHALFDARWVKQSFIYCAIAIEDFEPGPPLVPRL